MNSKRVDVLDYLRGAAIFSVLMVHCLSTAYGGDTVPWHGWFRNFSVRPAFLMMFPFSFGKEGVAIFFVVSGFCIHTSFQRSKNWLSFAIARFFRIYPPYFVAVLLFAFLIPNWIGHLSFHDPQDWGQLLSHLFLVHNVSPQYLTGINGAFWSLAVEVQLYLIYPVLLWLVRRWDWRKTMLLLAAIEIALRATISVIQTCGWSDTTWAKIFWPIGMSPFCYWFSWSLGAWIADAHLNDKPLPLVNQSLMFWVTLTLFSYFVKPLDSFHFLLVALTVAIVTSKLLDGRRPQFPIPAFIKKFFKQLGEWSYGIYLVHEPVLYVVFYPIMGWISFISIPLSEYLQQQPYMNQWGIIFRFLITLLSLVVIVIPLGVLWFRVLEQPSIAWGKKLKNRLKAKA